MFPLLTGLTDQKGGFVRQLSVPPNPPLHLMMSTFI